MASCDEENGGSRESDAVLPKNKDKQAGSSVDPSPPMSFVHMNCILCFNFVNGVLLGSYMLLILPLESQRIDYENRSMVLGVLMFLSGFTQLITPMVGLLSDRFMCSMGRRRPFITLGAIFGIAGIFGQDVASMNRIPWLYYITFTTAMFGLSTAYTAVVGLMADLVPAKQTGTGTGIAALQSVLGASAGFLIWDSIPAGNDDEHLHLMYMSYISITVACIFVTMVTSKEVPLQVILENKADKAEKAEHGGSAVSPSQWFAPTVQARDVIASYWIDPRLHFDFTMVFWSRTFYYLSCSVQTFFKYYLKDIVGVADAEASIVRIALIGQACAAVTAIPAGLLSDRIGQMRKPFIYGACVVLALGNVANCFLRNETDALVIGGFLGAANGVYLAMDAALALDHLPSGDEAARFMGVWGIGCFLGAALGPLIGGPILAFSGHAVNNPDAYNYNGYVILLCFAASGFGASGAILHKVGNHDDKDDKAHSGGIWVFVNKCLFSKRAHDVRKVMSHGPPDMASINEALPWVAGSSIMNLPESSPKNAL